LKGNLRNNTFQGEKAMLTGHGFIGKEKEERKKRNAWQVFVAMNGCG
jgi:hypothetical protein